VNKVVEELKSNLARRDARLAGREWLALTPEAKQGYLDRAGDLIKYLSGQSLYILGDHALISLNGGNHNE